MNPSIRLLTVALAAALLSTSVAFPKKEKGFKSLFNGSRGPLLRKATGLDLPRVPVRPADIALADVAHGGAR